MITYPNEHELLDDSGLIEWENRIKAIDRFESIVKTTIKRHACSRDKALRLIMLETSDRVNWDYLCYSHSLPYDYFMMRA